VTESTFDAYLFQTIENKQKFISQIMTSKSPARTCEDIDEQVLSYAEIKALCAGNPLIKEKIDLESEVGKLKMLKTEHRNQQYRMQDKMLTIIPKQIMACKQNIENINADIATLNQNTHKDEKGISPMTINGASYTSRAEAGEAITAVCKSLDKADNEKIGSYRGMDLFLSFDVFKTEWKVTAKGANAYDIALGKDAAGNVTRIDNALNNLPELLNSTKTRLTDLDREIKEIEAVINKPFEFEEKLNDKSARLAEVEVLLCKESESPEREAGAENAGQENAGAETSHTYTWDEINDITDGKMEEMAQNAEPNDPNKAQISAVKTSSQREIS
jgi:hypothetical protein